MALRKVNTKGIKNANKQMLMAATAYNLKKLLKFAKIPPTSVAQSKKVAKPLATFLKAAYIIILSLRKQANFFPKPTKLNNKKPAKGFITINYLSLAGVVQRLLLLCVVFVLSILLKGLTFFFDKFTRYKDQFYFKDTIKKENPNPKIIYISKLSKLINMYLIIDQKSNLIKSDELQYPIKMTIINN